MKAAPFLLLLLAVAGGPARAQEPHWRRQYGAEAVVWQMSAFDNVGLGVRAGAIRPRGMVPMEASLSVAPEQGQRPGVTAATLGFAPRFPGTGFSRRYPAIFLFAGAGAAYFSAGGNEAARASCAASPTCFYEGPSFRTGWRLAGIGGAGLEVPLSGRVLFRGGLDIYLPVGPGRGGPVGDGFGAWRWGLSWNR